MFLCLVLLISGILLMFYYTPTTEQAAESIQRITYLVPFGFWVRNLHYWSAQLLVLTSLTHLLRVIFSGAYAPPRRLNYLIGLLMFATILVLDFSGYLLRWDEGVRWALVVGSNLLKVIPLIGSSVYLLAIGGDLPNPSVLIRLYSWHIFGLSLVAVLLGVWHIFRVRRDGGIAVAPAAARQSHARISRFELAQREGLAILYGTVLLSLLSLFLPAPIAAPMSDISLASAEARAPWFFLWVQELLKYGPPFTMGVLVPATVFTYFALIPYLFSPPQPHELGEWFPKSGRMVQISSAIILLTLLWLTILVLRSVP